MIVFLNGKFVPEEQALVSVFDRGYLYGDGLFESMLLLNGKPFHWAQHLERLERGAKFLKIRIPFSPEELRDFARRLCHENRSHNSLLRLTLSRGVGLRGYSPKGAEIPTLAMSLHPVPTFDPENPPGWRLVTSSFRLPANEPLAHFKTCNKLPQVLARAEADAAGADEALLLNTDGYLAEGASSNLFWIANDVICTPPLAAGVLAGVTRGVVLELCQSLRLDFHEAAIRPVDILGSQGVFLSLSSIGLAAGLILNGCPLPQSALVKTLRAAYWDLVRRECN
jgi:aminodeoxychorismate lyase